MNIENLIAELREADIVLWVDDGRLRFNAPSGVMTDALRERLSENREALKDWVMTSVSAPELATAQSIARIDREGDLPLSYAQERLWFIDQLETGGASYNIAMALRLRGDLDVTALVHSFESVVGRHEILRSQVSVSHGRPVLRIKSWDSFDLPITPVQVSSSVGIDEAAREAAQLVIGTSFNLDRDRLLRARLLRISDDHHILVLVVHHIVSDVWSLGVLFNEIEGFYRERVTGEVFTPPPLPVQYVDYAAWKRTASETNRYKEQLAYWQQRLSNLTPFELPADRPRPITQSNRGGSLGFVIKGPLLEQCRQLWLRQQVTPFVLMLAVFKILIQRYTAVTDVAVGTPVAGRNTPGTECLIGCFLNTLVLRTDLSAPLSFNDLLSRVRLAVIEGQMHQDVPFEQILQVLELDRNLGRNPLFQLLFNFIDIDSTSLDLTGLEVSRLDADAKFTKFDLTCYVYAGKEQFSVTFDYATDIFEAETITTMLRHYRNLLISAVAAPDDPVERLSMRDAGEHQPDTEKSSPAAAIIPTRALEQTIVEWFSRLAEAEPQRPAVVTADKSVNRGELVALASRAAAGITHRFADNNQSMQSRIGLMFDDTVEMVAAALAVMKAGHVFVPLDPNLPPGRLASIAADADMSFIITQDSLTFSCAEKLPEGLRWSSLTDTATLIESSATDVDPDSLAYLLYTSGSTGLPKGVVQTHRVLMHHARAFCNALALSADDRLSQLSAFTFDTAIQDIFAALLSGATLCAVNLRDANAAAARREIEQQTISILHMTPTVFRHLFGSPSGKAALWSVRAVVLGGESARSSDLELCRQHFDPDCLLVNGLGATECTTVLQYRMDYDTDFTRRTIPVGFALPDTEILLLDPFGNETDVFGEIAVVGIPRGTAYWKDMERTAQRFRSAPGVSDNRCMYLTGDLGSRRADGSIVFEGRRDHQVKLRGMRIELSEVESVLDACNSVRRSAVALVGDPGREYLFAACEPQDARIDVDSLRADLRQSLPEYMIPSSIASVDALPLTASGKIDRKALCNLTVTLGAAGEPAEDAPPASELQRLIADIWRQVLGVESVGMQSNFFDLGGHSLLLVEVRARLQEVVGNNIPMPELFQYPTVASLASHLDRSQQPATGTQLRARPSGRHAADDESIAIVAMAARLPGADDLDEFWRNLCNGLEIIEQVSPETLIAEGVNERLVRDPRFVPVHSSINDVEMFDAEFFGYTPREAELMDPQQRLFLECASEALELAGYGSRRQEGATGVFAGAGMTNYLYNLLHYPDLIRASGGWQAVIRSDKDYLPMRVSYKLNLRGPSIDVQTACSTSLVAVHEARNSLLRFDCDMALAGGVTVRFPRHAGYLHEEGGILSPDGHCRPFDAKGAGTVFGEGVGVVVLKRLSEALRDGDHIRAVIRGTAVNNDGSDKVGFTAPSVSAQAELVAQAHAAAGVEPSSIGYVEAHGTGTSLGDPIEISALHQAFAGTQSGTCALGAVKSNIGHLDRAAGIAGLMKTVLMLEHGEIPPSLHYEAANPEIDFAAGPFYVNTVLKPWERVNGLPRRAGISSFGMGGTNAHAVLEEAPEIAASDPSRRWQVLPVSAKSEVALAAACENLAVHLEQCRDLALADVAYTLQVGRTGFERRVVMVCEDIPDAVRGLRAEAGAVRSSGEVRDGRVPEVVFLYPGQGTQYPNMGRELYEDEPVYRDTVDQCCAVLAEPLGLDLRTLLYPQAGDEDSAAESLKRTSLTQPALFVTEYALTQLLAEWGIRPVAMLGHSIGELVAACVSGVLDRDAALRLVAQRGRLMESAPAGVMISVLASAQQARGYEGDDVWLSVVNGPQASVLSCTPQAADALESRLQADDVAYQRLQTSHAFHCGLMDGVLEPLDAVSGDLKMSAPQLPYVSNVTGGWVDAELMADATYWSRQVREPVRFAEGVEALLTQYPDCVLLEVGPGEVLSQLVRGISKDRASAVVGTQSGAKDVGNAGARLAQALGELWCAGVEVDWQEAVCGERRLKVALPTYPFQRKRYWVDAARPGIKAQAPQRENDISRWFQVPAWQRALPVMPSQEAIEPNHWLLFGEDTELVRVLVASLREAGHRVSIVRSGEHFIADKDDYQIRPEASEDYDALFKKLAEYDTMPDCVVHLWALAGDAELDTDQLVKRCFHAPVNLVQSLDRYEPDTPLRIIFVSDGLQEVTGAESICPAKATLIGPCRVIPTEYPHIQCRSIDLLSPTTKEMQSLVSEFYLDSSDAFVAYRNGYRWTPAHLRSPLEAVDGVPSRLRQGGVYLITGGLGGIGLTLAKYLAQTCTAKLVLVTRRVLPPRREWKALLAADSGDGAEASALRAVRKLEASGAEVMVASADVCDPQQMAEVIARAQDRFGAIAGVIHAAGIAGGGVIQMKTAQAANAVLSPKILGAENLVNLLRGTPPDFMLLCSSINALYGIPGQVDYCAANAYLDALALQQRSESGTFTISVNWDTWREVGMAVETDVPDSLMQQRLESLATAITPTEGAQAFARVIESNSTQVLVTPRVDVVQSAASSRAPQQVQDDTARGTHERPALEHEYVEFRDELERKIVLIWRELLGLDRVGVEDNFLDLGGHSLLATQLLARLRRELGVDWTLDAVFKAPTVAEQAELVRQAQARPDTNAVSAHARRIQEMSTDERASLLAKARQAKV